MLFLERPNEPEPADPMVSERNLCRLAVWRADADPVDRNGPRVGTAGRHLTRLLDDRRGRGEGPSRGSGSLWSSGSALGVTALGEGSLRRSWSAHDVRVAILCRYPAGAPDGLSLRRRLARAGDCLGGQDELERVRLRHYRREPMVRRCHPAGVSGPFDGGIQFWSGSQCAYGCGRNRFGY